MKDARFKELLNLHLDHRLSAAEAEELETALRDDPVRRKALRDYEAMQSACSALFARTESRAPSSDALRRALRQAESRIEHPRSLRDAWSWPTWGLTGGLAACVALVVARLSQPGLGVANQTSQPEQPEQGAALEVAVAAPAPVVDTPARAPAPGQLAFAALGLTPNGADAASRWILQADEPAVYATVEEATAAGEAMPAWSAPAPQAVARHFSGRPINAVGGYQTEAVAYRFER